VSSPVFRTITYPHYYPISRFPVVAGFRVTWDSTKPPGQRILDISIERSASGTDSDGHTEQVTRDSTKTYNVITRDYMAQVIYHFCANVCV